MSPVVLVLSAVALTAAAAAASRAFAGQVVPDLTDDTKRALRALLGALAQAGIRVKVGSTGRSELEQARQMAAGRSATMQSAHRRGQAVDLYPIDPTTGFPDYAGRRLELYQRMHEIAARLGWRGLAFNPDGSRRYLQTARGRIWDGGHLEWKGATA